jgi:hypothetical protein
MYRTNAQSRALEESFVRANMPYRTGATRFYDRREVKDVLAYLRVIHNPNDAVSLRRAINTPPRGIGGKTLEALEIWAGQTGVTPGVALLSLRMGTEGPFSPRARESLRRFADLLANWHGMVEAGKTPLDIVEAVLSDTTFDGYLRNSGPDGEDRWENVLQLKERAAEFGDGSLSDFLIDTALVSDVDIRDDEKPGPSLMTLHSAKGLEYPCSSSSAGRCILRTAAHRGRHGRRLGSPAGGAPPDVRGPDARQRPALPDLRRAALAHGRLESTQPLPVRPAAGPGDRLAAAGRAARRRGRLRTGARWVGVKLDAAEPARFAGILYPGALPGGPAGAAPHLWGRDRHLREAVRQSGSEQLAEACTTVI